MSSVGLDRRTNSESQIRWGLGRIKTSYGTPDVGLVVQNEPTAGSEMERPAVKGQGEAPVGFFPDGRLLLR